MSATANSTGLSPQLAEIIRELDDASSGFQKLVARLAPGQLWKRPARGGWSVGECIDHLVVSAHQFAPKIEEMVRKAPAGSEPYRMDWRGALLRWFLEPPYRMKFKAVPHFEPHASDKDVLAEFLATQEAAKQLVQRCNGLAIDRLKMISPVDNRMTYNVYSAFRIMGAHERRHLWQAQRIADELGRDA